MINPFAEINWKPGVSDIRTFGKSLIIGGSSFAVAFTLLSKLVPAYADHATFASRAFVFVVLTGVLSWLIPTIGRPAYYVWFFVAACIGTVVTNTLLLLFYYGFFTVISLLMRLTGRDPLRLRRPATTSDWLPYLPVSDVKRYYRQY